MSHNYGYDSESDRWDAYQKKREEEAEKREMNYLKSRIDTLGIRVRELEAENAHLKRMADLMAEELSKSEIPPAVCAGCKEQDMFGLYSCGAKDCIYWMFSRKAREGKK